MNQGLDAGHVFQRVGLSSRLGAPGVPRGFIASGVTGSSGASIEHCYYPGTEGSYFRYRWSSFRESRWQVLRRNSPDRFLGRFAHCSRVFDPRQRAPITRRLSEKFFPEPYPGSRPHKADYQHHQEHGGRDKDEHAGDAEIAQHESDDEGGKDGGETAPGIDEAYRS